MDCLNCLVGSHSRETKGKDSGAGNEEWRKNIDQMVGKMVLMVVDKNGSLVKLSGFMDMDEDEQ